MLKKDVDRSLTSIVKSNRIKIKLEVQHSDILFELFEKTSLCYISKETHHLYVDYYKIRNRNIKMIFALRKFDNLVIPLSKKKIMSAVFPPKKIESKEEKHLRNFKSAARYLISDQVKEFRDGITMPITCPLSKKLLTNWSMIHIDHIVPFSILLEQWLVSVNIKPLDIKLKGGINTKAFADVSIAKSWQDYHRENATLQVLYHEANLKKSNKSL